MNINGMEATTELADQAEAITETKETQVGMKKRPIDLHFFGSPL